MADPTFGLVTRTVDNDPRPVISADLSTIGLVGPATDADPAVFPLDTPVKIYSNDRAKLKALGESEYLADAVRGINDQLGALQVAAEIVIVRTASPTGADAAAKLASAIAGIVGSSTDGTGLWALIDAPEMVSATPRIIVAPGYTAQLGAGGEANAVVAALPPVLNQLLAHAVVESAGTDQASDEAWRETLSSSRLIPVVGGVKVMDPVSGTVVVRPFAPRVAGLLARRDHEKGAPFHSAANQQVYGIVGPARPIRFNLTSDANEGQSLLSANMGILVRGEIGSDFAISSGGFVFIGTDNAGEDELWRFYNQTRGRDFIHISLMRALRYYLGRFNLTGQTIESIVNTMKFFLRDLKADQHILGYKVGFQKDQNSAEEIRLGHLTISFAAEEPAVLRKITTESSRYREAVNEMVANLEQQLNLAA
ncbi:phage tail protein [Microvirga sp. Mcv34]|uniref:phage tail protein n=1 Tax=Microvirga sp. Mcv34 TaxID=2926016 RepID=UPI0021CAA315|nr:phage tail protein [Microvirga sp. Mcv34]